MFPYWEKRSYAGEFGGSFIRSLIFNEEIVFRTSVFLTIKTELNLQGLMEKDRRIQEVGRIFTAHLRRGRRHLDLAR
jgi:hypothetical protein